MIYDISFWMTSLKDKGKIWLNIFTNAYGHFLGWGDYAFLEAAWWQQLAGSRGTFEAISIIARKNNCFC